MTFDLSREWPTADVRALLATVEDDRSWRLEVTGEGIAKLNDLSTFPDRAYEDALHRFFAIWGQGTVFVGPGAASDKELCRTIERIPRDNDSVLKGLRTLSAL